MSASDATVLLHLHLPVVASTLNLWPSTNMASILAATLYKAPWKAPGGDLHVSISSPGPVLSFVCTIGFGRSVLLYTRDHPESPDTEFDPENQFWVPYRVLAHHSDRIWDLTFSHCSMYLATAAWDNIVHLYRMDDPELSTEPEDVFFDANDMKNPQFATLNCMAKVWSVAFRPGPASVNSPVILTGAADSKIRVWVRDVWGLAWKQQVSLEAHSNTVTGTCSALCSSLFAYLPISLLHMA